MKDRFGKGQQETVGTPGNIDIKIDGGKLFNLVSEQNTVGVFLEWGQRISVLGALLVEVVVLTYFVTDKIMPNF